MVYKLISRVLQTKPPATLKIRYTGRTEMFKTIVEWMESTGWLFVLLILEAMRAIFMPYSEHD